MAFGEGLAQRIREGLAGERGLSEKHMFGGVAFLLNGKMCCGIVKDELMVRVGRDAYERALAERHVREMDFTGRAMVGYVFVEPEGITTRSSLARWLASGVSCVRALGAGTARRPKAAGTRPVARRQAAAGKPKPKRQSKTGAT